MATEPRNASELATRMQEEQRLLRQLGQVLRKHLAEIPELDRAEWLEGLRVSFERLRAHLQRFFQWKVTGGYLENLLEVRPTLSREIDQIRHEHGELLSMIDRIHEDLRQVGPDDRLLAGDIAARVLRLLAVLGQHQRTENMMALLVFNQDMGAGD